MTATEILLDCMAYYRLPVLRHEGRIVATINGCEIEVEANGLYKLRNGGQVVAPFDDLDELCNFIINC